MKIESRAAFLAALWATPLDRTSKVGLPSTNFALPSNLRVTDDTQLTIATCESIVETCAVSPESIANHFVRWYRERRISGIGSSTLKALIELDAGGHWAMVGATGERSAGNGAAMRIAPIAFFLDPDVDADRQTIREICRITHRNDEAYIGALAVLRSIRYAVDGGELNADVFTYLIDSLPDSNVRDRLIIIRGSSLTVDDTFHVSEPPGTLLTQFRSRYLQQFEDRTSWTRSNSWCNAVVIRIQLLQCLAKFSVPLMALDLCRWIQLTGSTPGRWFAKPLPTFHAHQSRCNNRMQRSRRSGRF